MMSELSVALEEYSREPEPTAEFVGVFDEFNLAGHGKKTKDSCGMFGHFLGCLNTHLHNRVTLDGVDYSGKVYLKPVFQSCHRPSCPICYRRAWAVREAEKIEARLAEAAKRFGLVEHIVASVPVPDYRLGFEALRAKLAKVLYARRVIGGVVIFHRDRFDRRHPFGKRWYVSPHFHVLGFILGGYGCRGCKKLCNAHGCDGFEGRTRNLYLKDGYIVKVLGKRITVGGTAWYQLNHSSYRVDAKRSNVATWFGVCSYRKLKVTVEMRKELCPLCQHELERLRYLGNDPEILACYGSSRRDGGKSGFWVDAYEDGRLVWAVDVHDRWKYES